jgi:hypothetical protein
MLWKWGEVKGFWSAATKRPKVQGRERWGVLCSEVQWSEVKWSDVKWSEVKRWSWVKCVYYRWHSSVAVCRFCLVSCLIIICFYLLFSNNLTYVFLNIHFMFISLFCTLVFYSVFLYYFVQCFSFLLLYKLPTFATKWKSNCSKQISYHISNLTDNINFTHTERLSSYRAVNTPFLC